MSEPYPPPPPPPYAVAKTRPSVVTRNAMYLLLVGIIAIVIAVLEFVYFTAPSSYVVGGITVVIAALAFIDCLGMLIGQSWALKMSGWSNRPWAQTTDVREYFGLQPTYPAYSPTAPVNPSPSPTCPTCGNPLRYVQQYQRWYCDKEQKYV